MELNKDVVMFSKLLSACVLGDGKLSQTEDVNWDFVFSCAVKNDVLPLLLPAFRSAGGVRKENIAAVEKRSRIDAYNETKKAVCASKLLNALKNNGVTAVVLKGIAYKAMYPYPELRKMSDLDLLVLDGASEKVYEVAKSVGSVTNDKEIHHFTLDLTLNVEVAQSLYPDKENSLFDEYLINCDISNDVLCNFTFYSDEFQTLSPTHNVLYCAYHMFKHFIFGGIGARQMCDFALIISRFSDEIDWGYVLNRAEKAKMTKFVYSLVRIAELYFSVDAAAFYEKSTDSIDDNTVSEVWCDMLEGGVFGVSTHEREIARSIVFRKIKGINTGESYRGLRAVFPPLSYMRKEFSYVDFLPLLLPVGWIHRLFKFIFKRLFKYKEFSAVSKARRSAEERLKIMDKLGI